jgi:hypothetical protein
MWASANTQVYHVRLIHRQLRQQGKGFHGKIGFLFPLTFSLTVSKNGLFRTCYDNLPHAKSKILATQEFWTLF